MSLPPPLAPPSASAPLHDFNDDTTPAADVDAAAYDFGDDSDDSTSDNDWNS